MGAAREALIDALAHDGSALLDALDGEALAAPLAEAAALLATVLGQDLDEGHRWDLPDRPPGRARSDHLDR